MVSQANASPRRQRVQKPQDPPNKPTPTRAPASPTLAVRAEGIDDTDDFMARNAWVEEPCHVTIHGEGIAVAEPARMDPEADLMASGGRNLALLHGQFATRAPLCVRPVTGGRSRGTGLE
jgi:hypothetical protein